ncbi:MAG: GNAT family N-acetyltransferase [Actinobacteria bacterium]|nr:GNAT family N-acetyltransferase [Actinomycetota bacterium]
MRIREATVADVDAIARVHVEAWRAAYPGLVPQAFMDSVTVETRRALWREHFGAPRMRALVVEGAQGIEGFASWGPAEDPERSAVTAELQGIYLLPRAIGIGLGRALLARATQDMATLGYERAILWVLEANARARRFYEAAGWRWDGSAAQHVFGDQTRPVVRYTVALEATPGHVPGSHLPPVEGA